MEAQDNGAAAAGDEQVGATEAAPDDTRPEGEEQEQQEGGGGEEEGGEGGDEEEEEDAWATGGWLDEETGAGWGEDGGNQGGEEEAAAMEESSTATDENKSTAPAGVAAGGPGSRQRGAGGNDSREGGGGYGRGGAGAGGAGGGKRGGLGVGSMRGGYTSGGARRGSGNAGGGRGGGYNNSSRGGPNSSSRPSDYDRRYGPASSSSGPPAGWDQRRLPPPMTLPPPTHLGAAPMPSGGYDPRGGLPAPYYVAGGGEGDGRYNGRGAGLPPPSAGPYGAPPPGHYHALPPPSYGQPPPPMGYPGQAPLPPHPQHPLHRGSAGPPPPTSSATMAPIQSFQKFMLEQTDEPSAEESLQRYAEYKFKYIEDYAKFVFEEKNREEWFADRYLPSSREEKKKARELWAKTEAARFSSQILQQPDLFVVSASLDPTTELEYHALVKKYSKAATPAAASAAAAAAAASETSGENKQEGTEASDANGAKADDGAETSGNTQGQSLLVLDAKSLEGHAEATLFIRPFSSEVPRAPLEALLRERGGPFLRFLMSDPSKNTFCNIRSAWLVYGSKEEAEAARQALHNTEAEHPQEEQVRTGQVPPPPDYFRPFTLHLFAHNGKRIMPAPAEMSDPKRVEKDAAQSLALALALDKEKGLEEDGLQKLLDTPAIKAELGRRNSSFRLDVVMSYLRRVHFVVYYGGDEFQDEGDLIFLAPQLYKRPEPYKAPEKPEELAEKPEPKWSDWTLRMDEKVAKLMETLEKGNRFEGLGAALQAQQEAEDKARQKWLLENMSNEDEGRWRCAADGCTKLFKSSEFLQKHLLLKHVQGLDDSLRVLRLEFIRKDFDLDQEKPLPPVQVDKGSGVLKAVPVGEVLAEVATVLGKDMSRWKQLIDDSTRRRERGGGGGGGGGRRYGPRPAISLGGGAMAAAAASGAGVGEEGGPLRHVGKNYKDIDVPKSTLLTVDYGDVPPPPPKRRRKKAGAE